MIKFKIITKHIADQFSLEYRVNEWLKEEHVQNILSTHTEYFDDGRKIIITIFYETKGEKEHE